jgi:hypothetical protein
MERMDRGTRNQQRRTETRNKIELGGLIIKAGLHHEERLVLLGALLEVKKQIADDMGARSRFAVLATEMFGDERD